MFASTDKINSLKFKLKSAIKNKLSKEKASNGLKNLEIALQEDRKIIKEEIEFISEQLTESKNQIADAYHQITMIDMCNSSEITKINAHIGILNEHKQGFEDLFQKAKEILEHHQNVFQEKESAKQELKKEKLLQQAKQNEQQLLDALAVEAECDGLERECSVLKKRNTAIMLKLRRKLLETEDKRRELMKVESSLVE